MGAQRSNRAEEHIRFYFDEETLQPHIYNHNIDEEEVLDILLNRTQTYVEDRQGRDGSRVAIGQTTNGRFLKIIYVPDPGKPSLFVITAYELDGKPLKAYRRARKGK